MARKLPAIVMVAALLSLVLAPEGLACKRHYRRAVHHTAKRCAVHHRVVHHYVACRRHHRVYGSITAKPYIVSHDVAAWPALPTPEPLAAIPEIPAYNPPPIPEPYVAPTCCQPCQTQTTCCGEGSSRHGRHSHY